MRFLAIGLASILMVVLGSGCKSTQKEPEKTLRIAVEDDPQSLDPRLGRNLASATSARMFFEGLMSTDSEGSIRPAVARAVSISPDQKKYTFYLKETKWSDGTPVTAEDFAETWKSILSPTFPAPNAYQLFTIKNGKSVKEGKMDVDQLGVFAEDPQTLVVELEKPIPYFLKLVTTHFYFPVHRSMRQSGYGEVDHAKSGIIGNGPFKLERWKHGFELLAVKNPSYWNASKIKLEGIRFAVHDANTAIQLFEMGQLDWVGSPLATLPQDSVQPLKNQGHLKAAPMAGVYWLRVNTLSPPFQAVKFRKAFALAIDRQALVDHVTQGGQQPALSIVPPALFGPLSQNADLLLDADLANAHALFLEAAMETSGQLPEITLSYSMNDRNHKLAQALQQQWERLFNIQVRLLSMENKLFQTQLATGKYQLAIGSWFADFSDPINFLEIFKYQSNATNSTGWENQSYIQLLDRSQQEGNNQQRMMILKDAERLITEEMPVIPLFVNAANFLTTQEVRGVIFSELGYLDFKQAEILP